MNNDIELRIVEKNDGPMVSFGATNITTNEVVSNGSPSVQYAWMWAAQKLAAKLTRIQAVSASIN